MSVRFLTGKPGDGKTTLAVRMIVEELRRGRRCVVTNIKLSESKLAAFLGDAFEVGRYRYLETQDQMRGFFLHRGWSFERGAWVDWLDQSTEREVRVQTEPDNGILYVLDEAHLYYNATEWKEVGKAVLWYISQHRKLGDDVLVITQHSENVAKQFRVLAQDCIVLRNLGQRSFFGFRGPSRFVHATFPGIPPRMGTELATGTFKLDVAGYGQLFDTSAGVGLGGGVLADTQARRKGLPWWSVFPLVGVIGVVVWIMCQAGGTAFAHVLGFRAASVATPPPSARAVASTPLAQSAGSGAAAASTAVPVVSAGLESTNVVVAWSNARGGVWFCGDGAELPASTVRWSKSHLGFIAADGTFYRVPAGLLAGVR